MHDHLDDANLRPPDSSEPTASRKAELSTACARNTQDGRPPFDEVEIRTKGELEWILRWQQWSDEADITAREQAHLSGAIFVGANLSGISLRWADLSRSKLTSCNLSGALLGNANFQGASLDRADLTGAYLELANLTGALLSKANLSKASLRRANLSRARLSGANLSSAFCRGAILRRARLVRANLQSAYLRKADLRGANLSASDLRGTDMRECRLDAETKLDGVMLDIRIRCAGLTWGEVSLANVDWSQAPRLGDELAIKQSIARAQAETDPPKGAAAIRKLQIERYRSAATTYHRLVVALRSQGITDAASTYYLREQFMDRQALLRERKIGAWLFSLLLAGVAGYGERPSRTLSIYGTLLTLFTLAYIGVAECVDTRLSTVPVYDWVALSITAFHGRGFFPGLLPQPPSGWVIGLSLVEALVGLFIELIFIATFSHRFIAS